MSDLAGRALTGPEKAAVLLMALGSERSTQLVSALTSQEIEVLASHLARTQEIDEGTRERVLGEFQSASMSVVASEGGIAYARELLTHALGPERAASVISRREFASEMADLSGWSSLELRLVRPRA